MNIKSMTHRFTSAIPAFLVTATVASAEPISTDVQLGLDGGLKILNVKIYSEDVAREIETTVIVNEEKALEWLKVEEAFPSYPIDRQSPWWGG